jgi:hypothetical protein
VEKIPKTQKKLREAQFFLAQVSKVFKSTNLEREDFEFFLSAFLSAGRSVTFCLRVEQAGVYKQWLDGWEKALDGKDRELLKSMNQHRVAEVHKGGSNVQAEIEMVPVTRLEMEQGRDPRYSIFWYDSPGAPPLEIERKAHYFCGASGREEVIGTCQSYLGLLERLVRDFEKILS